MSCILLRCKWPFGPFAFNKLIDWLIDWTSANKTDSDWCHQYDGFCRTMHCTGTRKTLQLSRLRRSMRYTPPPPTPLSRCCYVADVTAATWRQRTYISSSAVDIAYDLNGGPSKDRFMRTICLGNGRRQKKMRKCWYFGTVGNPRKSRCRTESCDRCCVCRCGEDMKQTRCQLILKICVKAAPIESDYEWMLKTAQRLLFFYAIWS